MGIFGSRKRNNKPQVQTPVKEPSQPKEYDQDFDQMNENAAVIEREVFTEEVKENDQEENIDQVEIEEDEEVVGTS